MHTEVASTSGGQKGKFRSWRRGLSISRKLLSADKTSTSIGVFSESAGVSCEVGGPGYLMGEPPSSSKSSLGAHTAVLTDPAALGAALEEVGTLQALVQHPQGPCLLEETGSLEGEVAQCLPLLAN